MKITPRISVLSSDQIRNVHNDSLRILEKAGVRVDCPEALSIFKRSDSVETNGKIVYIKSDLVEDSILSSPESINVYKKTGDLAFVLGSGPDTETRFGIGVTNPNFQDPISGKIEPFQRMHTRYASKLGDILDTFDMISTPGVPTDCAPQKLDLFSLADMYSSTDKPLVTLLLADKVMTKAVDMLKDVHGDISSKPFILPYVNPVTPLILNESTTDKMVTSIENDLPLIFSNYGMSGGTTPVDGIGTLTLLNAELLAGLVFSQLVRSGSKIILGSLPARFNMQSMVSTYTPESYLINLACAEMMDHYKIPHCGTSGSGTGWGADINAAGDLWLNMLSSVTGKIGIAPFIGGNFDSKAFSPSLVILASDIILKSRMFMGGLNGSAESYSLDEINDLGPGGDYLTAMSTLSSLTGLQNKGDEIWPSIGLDEWRGIGSPDAQSIFNSYVSDINKKVLDEIGDDQKILKEFEQVIDKY